MRRTVTFACGGETLAATLDTADGDAALLIVSGGNELRIGAHRGMAQLAADIAAAGYPVLRYDRRGIGDSTGTNGGFLSGGPDLVAAVAWLRAETGVMRVVGFGNCDAATTLALFHAPAGIDRLLLANPWVAEPVGDLPPAAAIRATYAERLRSQAAWRRLLTGRVDPVRLMRGVAAIVTDRHRPSDLMIRVAEALGAGTPADILIADGDLTARAFLAAWQARPFAALRNRIPLHRIDSASHSFARPGDRDWLRARILAALSRD